MPVHFATQKGKARIFFWHIINTKIPNSTNYLLIQAHRPWCSMARSYQLKTLQTCLIFINMREAPESKHRSCILMWTKLFLIFCLATSCVGMETCADWGTLCDRQIGCIEEKTSRDPNNTRKYLKCVWQPPWPILQTNYMNSLSFAQHVAKQLIHKPYGFT